MPVHPVIVRLLHVSALVFTAWWLIATTAPQQPARDCFTGIGGSARLRVAIGAMVPGPDAGTPATSCAGIDGLGPGAVLTFDLVHGARPDTAATACYGYDTTALAGAADVTFQPPLTAASFNEKSLTSATGSFASSTRVSCRGTWRIDLRPESAPPAGQLISPLEAGTAQLWFLVRSIDVAQAQFCDGAFASAGEVFCSDAFVVDAIAEEPAP